MARVPDGRAPALAQNPEQEERRERLLEVAADLGERDGLERVQMTEIAKTAEVAVGTLYRYFPSKQKLFELLLFELIWRFVGEWQAPDGDDRLTGVEDELIGLTRKLAARPRLAVAMVRCVTSGYPDTAPEEIREQQNPLVSSVLSAIGIDDPTQDAQDRAQLVMYAWWSVTVAIVSNATSPARGEHQIRMATRLILGDCVQPSVEKQFEL